MPAALQAPALSQPLLWSLLLLGACGAGQETPVATAQPGATLVRSGDQAVILEQPFRPGVPNGLYRGIVRITGPAGSSQRHELNGVCSMPGLQSEDWPAYDNLYGKSLGATEQQPSATTQAWQVLLHFDGRVEGRGTPPDQQLLSRLRDNLCRRGNFDDSKKSARQ